jgi:cysteine desulfurase
MDTICLNHPSETEEKNIYFDTQALHPVLKEVRESLVEWIQKDLASMGNPSSIHADGRRASRCIESAKQTFLKTLGFSGLLNSEELYFTDSGTRANQIALQLAFQKKPKIWFYTGMEHASILKWLPVAEGLGIECRQLPLTASGVIDLEIAQALIERMTAGSPHDQYLLTLLWVNNETGVIQELESCLKKIVPRRDQWLVMIDAVSALGKLSMSELQSTSYRVFDILTFSGHKIGALSGIGALVLHPEFKNKMIFHEYLLGGTPNLVGMMSFQFALQQLEKTRDRQLQQQTQLQQINQHFLKNLKQSIPSLKWIQADRQTPYILSLVFEGYQRKLNLVRWLDQQHYSTSAGSACQSAVIKPSHVIQALGYRDWDAHNVLRISYSIFAAPEQIEANLKALSLALVKACI